VATTNGLLDVERRQLLEHSPKFFNQTSVPFNYDPEAGEPKRWLGFLGELCPNEPEAIDALGEWFGYVISGRTDLHKILLMVGPTRGGKGVIARVLEALIGRKNVAAPTLNSFGGRNDLIVADIILGLVLYPPLSQLRSRPPATTPRPRKSGGFNIHSIPR
jgi:putative DNA primase/helicase